MFKAPSVATWCLRVLVEVQETAAIANSKQPVTLVDFWTLAAVTLSVSRGTRDALADAGVEGAEAASGCASWTMAARFPRQRRWVKRPKATELARRWPSARWLKVCVCECWWAVFEISRAASRFGLYTGS